MHTGNQQTKHLLAAKFGSNWCIASPCNQELQIKCHQLSLLLILESVPGSINVLLQLLLRIITLLFLYVQPLLMLPKLLADDAPPKLLTSGCCSDATDGLAAAALFDLIFLPCFPFFDAIRLCQDHVSDFTSRSLVTRCSAQPWSRQLSRRNMLIWKLVFGRRSATRTFASGKLTLALSGVTFTQRLVFRDVALQR